MANQIKKKQRQGVGETFQSKSNLQNSNSPIVHSSSSSFPFFPSPRFLSLPVSLLLFSFPSTSLCLTLLTASSGFASFAESVVDCDASDASESSPSSTPRFRFVPLRASVVEDSTGGSGEARDEGDEYVDDGVGSLMVGVGMAGEIVVVVDAAEAVDAFGSSGGVGVVLGQGL